jgi:phospholipid/cholesterol/gamma-HCH transport system ATP-binding protein
MTTRRKNSEPILRAQGVVNRFGKQLVHDKIDVDVRPGEILGIVGGSGSGKSVLLKTLIGLHRPNSGTVMLNGKAIETIGPTEKAALVGVLFQQGALFSSLSVAQNVMLPMREHTDLPVSEQERLTAVKLELAGMPDDSAVKFPSQLSGGMIKRAALARALALDPRILFLDEPTSDLDSLTASGIDALILQLNQGLGITVVIVTHDLNTVVTICDRVAVLADHKIIIDTVDKLARSADPWIHDLLHSPRALGALHARKSGHGIG